MKIEAVLTDSYINLFTLRKNKKSYIRVFRKNVYLCGDNVIAIKIFNLYILMKRITTLFFALLIVLTISAQQLAFPGAEGFGAYATGGRGGEVVHVTNLNATGAGSLADAVSKPNRIVVFDVGGVIKLTTSQTITISNNITIAGQTAPGEGITIYGNRVIANGNNIIIRYIRMRGSIAMNSGKCTFTCDNAENVILDHCSISWGRWDNCHITSSNNITWQNCIISEGIDPQNFGAITDGTRNWTITHCLWANNKSRNPKLKCYAQQINNVIYNYGNGIVGGHSAADNYQDVIGCYFINGPFTSQASPKHFNDWTATDHLYSKDNYTDTNCDGVLNGTLVTDYNGATVMQFPHLNPSAPVTIESVQDAYKTIVDNCGASRVRDLHDTRIINQLTSLGKEGAIIYDEAEVGGIGTINGGTAPKDTDNDGMPDEWETANGLNPNDPSDYKLDSNNNGYTNLEDYINSLAGESKYLMYPGSVSAKLTNPTTVLIKWQNIDKRATKILLEQSENGINYSQVKELEGTATEATITGLKAEKMYYFRLRNTDGERFSLYSEVVTVGEPEGLKAGGGTEADTKVFEPKKGKLYRIISYASVVYNSKSVFSGSPHYMCDAKEGDISVFGSTDNFAYDNPALLWRITTTKEGSDTEPAQYSIVNYKNGKSLSATSELKSDGSTVAAYNNVEGYIHFSDNTETFNIVYTENQKCSQSGTNAELSFFRIHSPANQNSQIRGYAMPNHWVWMKSDWNRADMVFTFQEIDESLVRLYTASLQNAITAANNFVRNAKIGDGTLEYPDEAYAAFIAVIDKAETFLRNIDPLATPQKDVDDMTDKLSDAQTAFSKTMRKTWGEYDAEKVYNIYSLGTMGNASATTAESSTRRRYLTANDNNELYFRAGLTEPEIADGSVDAVKTDKAAMWIIRPSATNDGYFTARNVKSLKWLQIALPLTDSPVEFYPAYNKDDLGHHGFSLQVSATDPRCFNVGTPADDGNTGTISFASFVDRVRVRWIFEEAANYNPEMETPTGIKEITNQKQTDKTYNLAGQRVNKTYKGIIITPTGKKIVSL